MQIFFVACRKVYCCLLSENGEFCLNIGSVVAFDLIVLFFREFIVCNLFHFYRRKTVHILVLHFGMVVDIKALVLWSLSMPA